MAEVRIQGGAMIDIPTAQENAAAVDHGRRGFAAEQAGIERAREREYARAVKWMRIAVSDPLTPTKETITGPEIGYSWKLRRFTCTISAADSVSLYTGTEAANNRLIAFTPSVATQVVYVITFSPEEIIRGGESVFATTSGTGHFSAYYLSAWQVPTEMEWKFL
jgi:hypothetical protein